MGLNTWVCEAEPYFIVFILIIKFMNINDEGGSYL
jgi:hypothetical protein